MFASNPKSWEKPWISYIAHWLLSLSIRFLGDAQTLQSSIALRYSYVSLNIQRSMQIVVWRLDGGERLILTILTLEAEITIMIANTCKTGVTGKPFNSASYALLSMIEAQVFGLKPGEFVHTLGDTHLYRYHFELAATQLSRTPKSLPVMKINPSVFDLFAFTFAAFYAGRV